MRSRRLRAVIRRCRSLVSYTLATAPLAFILLLPSGALGQAPPRTDSLSADPAERQSLFQRRQSGPRRPRTSLASVRLRPSGCADRRRTWPGSGSAGGVPAGRVAGDGRCRERHVRPRQTRGPGQHPDSGSIVVRACAGELGCSLQGRRRQPNRGAGRRQQSASGARCEGAGANRSGACCHCVVPRVGRRMGCATCKRRRCHRAPPMNRSPGFPEVPEMQHTNLPDTTYTKRWSNGRGDVRFSLGSMARDCATTRQALARLWC
jgi:hypothetical protein